MVKKIAEKFNRLSRVHQRRQTDGRPIAYSERNVVRSLKTDMLILPTPSACICAQKWKQSKPENATECKIIKYTRHLFYLVSLTFFFVT